MAKMNRRDFLKTTLAGATVLGTARLPAADAEADPFQLRSLGSTDIHVSLIGAGSGMKGWMRESNQTRLGEEAYLALIRHAFDRGVRFFDCADIYGSHPYLARALADVPREEYAISTKIWYHRGGIPEPERPDPDAFVERFCEELGTEYIDLVLLHCMMSGQWPEEFSRQMDVLSSLKERGLVRAVGVSCHSLEAVEACIDEERVDSVHTRLNAYGDAMDGDPETVAAVVKRLREAGKGVVAMKLIGEGRFRDDPAKRDASIRFVLERDLADTMIVGFERPEEVDDFATRVERILAELE